MREQESGSSRTKVQVRHLTKKFGDLLVLDDISFDVEKGDLLCVVGPTGCGKTTFLNSLTRIYDITSGEILLDGHPVDPKKDNIAYIFQGNSTMPWLTVEQNVAFGLDIKHTPQKKAPGAGGEISGHCGTYKISQLLPKTAFRQHAAARIHCQGFCHGAGAAAHGRTLRAVGY